MEHYHYHYHFDDDDPAFVSEIDGILGIFETLVYVIFFAIIIAFAVLYIAFVF